MIEFLLVVVACAAPWAFGCWDPSWGAALSATLLTLGALGLLVSLRSSSAVGGAREERRGLAWTCLLLPLPALLGLLPVPPWLHALLVPAGAALRSEAGAGEHWTTISLHGRATLAAAASAVGIASAIWIWSRGLARSGVRLGSLALFMSSGVALAVFAILQSATQTSPPTIYWRVPIYEVATPFGPFVNRNHFAGAMEVFLPVTAGAAAALWLASRRALAFVVGAAAAVQAVALVATQSRGGAIGASAGAAFLGWCAWSRPGAGAVSRRRLVLWAVLGLAAVGAGVAILGLSDELVGRLQFASRQINRLLVQRDALSAFAQQPLLGTGAGTFPEVFPAWQRANDLRTFENAHSDWAQWLMETGLVGVAVIVVAVRALLATIRRARRAVEGAPSWIALGGCAALVSLAVHGLLDVNFHCPANALLAAFAASLAFAASAPAPPGSHPGPRTAAA